MNNESLYDKFRKFMRSLFYVGIGKSLLIWFLAISFVPLATVSFINYLNTYLGLTVIAERAINTTSQLRLEFINNYFQDIVSFLELQSGTRSNIEFLNNLKKNYDKSNLELKEFINTETWENSTDEKTAELYKIAEKQGYYDIFYIDVDGNILFSLKKQHDLGTNLFNGKYANTLFSNTCIKIFETGNTLFSDLEFYEPSNNDVSGFLGHLIVDNKGNKLGIFAVQINIDGINKIITDKNIFGETGEAYLVGKDLLFRSVNRFDSSSIILRDRVDNKKVLTWHDYITHKDDEQYLINKELGKEEVTTYTNTRGKNVLGLYRNLEYLQDIGVNWALLEEIEHDEAFAYSKQLSDIAKIAFIVTVILVSLISILVTNRFVGPIKKLSAWAKQVAIGELVIKRIRAPKNEVGEMVDTFNRLVISLRSYADVSQLAAIGDYSNAVEIRSKDDVLGKSMNQMVESFKDVVKQSNKIAKGDYSANIVPRSDKDTLGVSLYEMTKTLRETSKEIREQDWLKTGLNILDGKLSGQKDINKLTNDVITFLVKQLEAQIGLLYLTENEEYLNLSSSYAFEDTKNKFGKLKFGEGLIGQVAKDKNKILFSNVEKNVPELNYGVNKIIPKYFFIAPIIFEDKLIGVIQIGSINQFTELQQLFLDKCLESIAIAINTTQSHAQVKKLLTQTQEQANELTVQQEELRQANEELEEQTKALKLSEENLQSQQEELRVINEELEARTNDLEIQRDDIRKKNEELERAQVEIEQKARALELASRYKSEFMANMSHELRTPLNSILVLSQLLSENRKEHLNKKESEYARTINSSGYDLLNLINDILDLSKVESGKLELHIERLYFDELKDYIDKTFLPLTDEKGLKLDIKINKDVPKYINSDIQRINQIIKNLFSNAIKFTSKGNVSLKVFRPKKNTNLSISGLKPENTVAFAVSDTGIGVSKEKFQAIFEAFQQADGTTSRKFGGTGLGLTISKSFASILGGEIQLESTEGAGSTFTLFLPDSISEKKPDREIKEEKNLISSQSYNIKDGEKIQKKVKSTPEVTVFNDDRNTIEKGDKFILIIEDDINFCNVLYELAHERGFKCMVALDGESGLHYTDFFLPSAVILDVGLPGIDGYEVMKRLKENPKTRHIPVHFISASDRSIEAMKMGAIGYLTKPVSHEKLIDVFKKIENIIAKPIKKILVVEDEELVRKSIVNLLGNGNVSINAVESGEEAYELIIKNIFDCLILDLGLKNMSGFDLLEKIRKNKKITDLPVIIYTGKELTKDEDERLQRYADSIIIKGARSFERLLSETALFLHQIETEMPENKQEMLKVFHSKEAILEGKNILIIDDDMRNVFALSSVLEEEGVKITIGRNGKEGIEKLYRNPKVDLIIMDIMMPEMDGYEAIAEIRKDNKYKKLPIIALTAKAMKEDRDKCIAAGANDYLAKPVNTDKLISLLRVWLYK
jgi:CheY-like chemotaxis protein/signal transduction histidine kinase/methyl-accepting chemotaxis protein